MKKKDIMLAAILLLVAFLLFLVLQPKDGAKGGQIQITVDGVLYGTYSLFEEREIRVEQERGVNLIYVRDGAAWMAQADCPDGYCIGQGKIREKGQSIVCLPHRLVVEVTEANGDMAEEGQQGFRPPDAVVH